MLADAVFYFVAVRSVGSGASNQVAFVPPGSGVGI